MPGKTIATLMVKMGLQTSEFNKGMKDLKGKLKNIGDDLDFFGGLFKKTAGIISVGLIAKKVFDDTAKFQSELAKLGASTNTTGSKLEDLGKRAIELSNQFGISSEEIIHGMMTLRNLGLDTEEALQALPNILKAVVGVGADFETTAAVMETALNDFNFTAKDSSHISDVLIKSMREGNFTMENWRYALQEAGSAAADANASFEDVAAALSVFGKASIRGNKAGTALRNIFIGISKELSSGGKLFEKYGISIKNEDGTIKNFRDLLTSVQQRFKELTPEQRTNFSLALVGKENYSKLNTLIQRSPDDFNKLSDAMKKTADDAKKSSQSQLDTLDGQLNRTKEITSNIGKQLGMSLSEIGTSLLKFTNDVLEETSSLIEEYNEYEKGLVEDIKSFFKSLPPFFKGIWNTIVSVVSEAWEKIKNKAQGIWNTIKTTLEDLTKNAVEWGANFIGGIAKGIDNGIEKVKSAARRVANAITGFFKSNSPPKKGPLHTADQWMPNFMDMMSQGIEMGIPRLKTAVIDAAATVRMLDNASGGVNNTVNIYPRNANLSAGQVMRELDRANYLFAGGYG